MTVLNLISAVGIIAGAAIIEVTPRSSGWYVAAWAGVVLGVIALLTTIWSLS